MKRKFQVVVSREGEDYVARCHELVDAVARGRTMEEAIERLKIVIGDKLRPDQGPGEGSAPVPQPASPHGGAPGVAKEQPRKEDGGAPSGR